MRSLSMAVASLSTSSRVTTGDKCITLRANDYCVNMDFRQHKNLLRSRHLQLEESVFAKLSLWYLIHPAIASAADATSTSQVWVVAGDEFNPYAVDRILHYRVLVLPMCWNGQRMMKGNTEGGTRRGCV